MCASGSGSGLRAVLATADGALPALLGGQLAELRPGLEVRHAATAGELLAVARAGFDLLVADVGLPSLDVAELGRLRGEDPWAVESLIVLVDQGQLACLSGLAHSCVDDVIVTPAKPEELAARLRLGLCRLDARRRRQAKAQALEDLYERQSEFLSMVSHEIRTPLSAIMSSAGILRRYGRERPESVERFAAVIQEEGRRLTRLINNLLDLAKIEAGQIEWQLEPTRVGELLEFLQESFAALVGERRLTLQVEPALGPPRVVVDRDKMTQVLVNLLSNAVKHSPEGSVVHLRCGAGPGGSLRIEVEDEGSGIPAGQEERIFGRFQQLEVGDERSGTGLGLTISRQIVEHHGGRVWAEPGRERGALFVVEVPVGTVEQGGPGAV